MRRRLSYRPAIGGLVFVIWVLVLVMAVVWRPSNLLIWVMGTAVGMIVISGLSSGAMMMALRVRRLAPSDARVGQPLVLLYEVRNTSWLWPAFAVSIRESALGSSQGWLVSVGPGERCVVELAWWPERRGEVELEHVIAQSSFPFGLVGKRVTWRKRATITVLPRVVRIPAPRLRALLDHGPAGQRAAARPGHGEEFFGVRDAPELTSLRDVAWRRSASREQLVVIERASPSYPRLRLVLNLSEPTDSLAGRVPAGVKARQREEDAITMAASLATSAIALGHEISLRVHGLPCVAMPAAGGVRHLDRVLVQLAKLDLDAPRTTPMVSVPGDERSASVVIHPGRIDPSVGGAAALHQSAAQLPGLASWKGTEP